MNLFKKINPVIKEISELEIGESLEVLREEWFRKTSLGIALGTEVHHPRGNLRDKKFQCRSLLFNKGWLVTRRV